jgi:MSHA biogenesis protein MshM
VNNSALMYEPHFGLQQQPFALTPNTRFFLNAAGHFRALQTLILALDGLDGFIKVIGEVGTGKTMLCRKLMNSLDERYVTALVLNPMLSSDDLYRAFADELGVELTAELGTHELLKAINQALIENARKGKRVLLIIDEAQVMPEETLEALRLLTNLETESRKLLQVVLFGQPELDEMMGRKSMRQMAQRITFQENLLPLDLDGVDCYIQHRIQVAGFEGKMLFKPAAVRRIYRESHGVPRLINILAHKSLLAAFGSGDSVVSTRHVRRAVADTDSVKSMGSPFRWFRRAA